MKRAIVTSSRDMEDTVVDWRRDLEYIKGMRKFMDAPVDTMGCHKLADPLAEPKVHRFQVLVALMLSSQTRDQVNAAAMERLKKFGLTIDKIISMDKEALEQLIRPVGFYRRKSIFLQETAHILRNKYASDIPETFDELCALPGVGPKMANLVMQIAWGKCVGIAVDTHVHRITNRLGWINTTTPEKTEKALEILLPKEEWIPINHLLVGFGQMMCHPVRPRCGGCALGRTCPSSLFKEWYREREGIYVKKEIKDDVVVEEFEEEMEEEEMMGEKKEETMGEIKEEVKEEKMREKMGETVRETKEEKLRETKKEIKKETKEETMREMEAKKEEEEEEPVRKTKRTKIRIEKEEE